MAKNVKPGSIGAPKQLYRYSDGFDRPKVPPRVVQVGTLSGLVAAVGNAVAGDVVEIVWPGDYRLANTLVQNVANLTIRARDTLGPDQVVIRGFGMDNPNYGGPTLGAPHGIYSAQPGLTVQNLTIADFYFHGVTFGAGATAPTFDTVIFEDMGQQFIKVSQFPASINNGLVKDCTFKYTAGRPATNHLDFDMVTKVGWFYGGPIDVHNSAGWHIVGSRFEEIAPTAAEAAAAIATGENVHLWSPAAYFWNRSTAPLIENNVFVNCGRAIAMGLLERTDGTHDCYGGIARNNMVYIAAGRLGQTQIDDSDAQILLWDCPGGEALHNTLITHGQIANAVQGRWAGSSGLVIANNLSDASIRMRETAVFTGAGHQANAANSWFADAAQGDLHLSATGQANVQFGSRMGNALYDINGGLRAMSARVGAHNG